MTRFSRSIRGLPICFPILKSLSLSSTLSNCFLLIVFVTTSASAADRQRVDLYDRHGQREGYAIIDGNRVDLYDRGSRRIGQGRVSERGDVELFDRYGKRLDRVIVVPVPTTKALPR